MDRFKAYDPGHFVHSELCNHYLSLVSNFFMTLRTPQGGRGHSCFHFSKALAAATNMLSIFIDLLILDISYKRKHTIWQGSPHSEI